MLYMRLFYLAPHTALSAWVKSNLATVQIDNLTTKPRPRPESPPPWDKQKQLLLINRCVNVTDDIEITSSLSTSNSVHYLNILSQSCEWEWASNNESAISMMTTCPHKEKPFRTVAVSSFILESASVRSAELLDGNSHIRIALEGVIFAALATRFNTTWLIFCWSMKIQGIFSDSFTFSDPVSISIKSNGAEQMDAPQAILWSNWLFTVMDILPFSSRERICC